MNGSSSSDSDAKKKHWEAWAKSWKKIQQEQLDRCMDNIQRSLFDQQTALQNALKGSFDKHVEQMQSVSEESGSFVGIAQLESETVFFSHHEESAEAQKDQLTLTSESRYAGKQKTMDFEERVVSLRQRLMQKQERQKTVMLNSWRRAVGWVPGEHVKHMHSLFLSDILPVDQLQALCLKITRSLWFEVVTGFLVVANTVVIAVEADYGLKHALKHGESDTLLPRWMDILFASCFTAELVTRMLAERWDFFHERNRLWNAFDCFVVGSALVELLFETINFSFIRVLRIFRMLRVVRIIRVFKEFRQLRLMISSIVTSLLTLIWAFVLLSLVVFLFAVIIIQGAAHYLSDVAFPPLEMRHAIDTNFGSLVLAMYTLLTVVSGGQDWEPVASVCKDMSNFYFSVFIFYVVFVIFGVLNVLTGIFVESASHISSVDHDLVLQAEMDRNDSFINEIERLFQGLDQDNSGTIDWEEFTSHLEDPRVLAYFSELQLDVSEAKGVFQLLDTDETGSIAIEEFVLGCMRLKGSAKSIDIATMLFEAKKQNLVNQSSFERINIDLEALHRQVEKNSAMVLANSRAVRSLESMVKQNTAHVQQNIDHLQDLDSAVKQNSLNHVRQEDPPRAAPKLVRQEVVRQEVLYSHDNSKDDRAPVEISRFGGVPLGKQTLVSNDREVRRAGSQMHLLASQLDLLHPTGWISARDSTQV